MNAHCHACAREVDAIEDRDFVAGGLSWSCSSCGAKVAPSVLAVKVESAPAPKSAAPADVLSITKQRLSVVREQITKLRAFEAEERMLAAMIEAAEKLNA